MIQTNLVYSNDNQGRVYQNCKFHDPRGRGSCARAWPYKSYSENDIQILALLTRSQCKVSDTQVTVKACGPLVSG